MLRVALRKESVDRNLDWDVEGDAYGVALRKESVDRNSKEKLSPMLRDTVALRKESVDRNLLRPARFAFPHLSLSARRAWIEIWLGIA